MCSIGRISPKYRNSDFRSVSWYFIPWYFIVYLPVATYDASDFVNGCNCGPCQFSLDKICDAKDSCLTSLSNSSFTI